MVWCDVVWCGGVVWCGVCGGVDACVLELGDTCGGDGCVKKSKKRGRFGQEGETCW